jgi:hypothetical protein
MPSLMEIEAAISYNPYYLTISKPFAAFVEFTTIAELTRAASRPHSYKGKLLLVQSRNPSVTVYKKPITHLDPSWLPPNTILYFSGVDPVTTTENLLCKVFAKYANVSRVHYRRDDTSGYVHLDESVATEVAEKLQETGLQIGVDRITVRALQGMLPTEMADAVDMAVYY